ncbi:hypothetical protein LV82_00658 [Albidovulum inexpectatum]|uniref:Uncharacterized protein n=1 Tax=Albidovulum inexpectatum TaxID=196587 RepID=A0A2S5JMU8_9RHOB|nr:hypothetical protein [Albidovulum inexpectatum]PPB82718.1 hypothetical protein LV82_00658 [Albidovulum inexpectatum]
MRRFLDQFANHGDPFMPYPDNGPTADDLVRLDAAEIARLPVDLLAILQREVDERLKQAKAAKARLDGALTIRYATRAEEERRARGKDTGAVRFDDGDFTVVADLPKRVDWDQEQLAAMVARIRAAGDDPSQYVDVTYKVPERKYAAWPEAIRAGFEPARTMRPGKPAFHIIPQSEKS